MDFDFFRLLCSDGLLSFLWSFFVAPDPDFVSSPLRLSTKLYYVAIYSSAATAKESLGVALLHSSLPKLFIPLGQQAQPILKTRDQPEHTKILIVLHSLLRSTGLKNPFWYSAWFDSPFKLCMHSSDQAAAGACRDCKETTQMHATKKHHQELEQARPKWTNTISASVGRTEQ